MTAYLESDGEYFTINEVEFMERSELVGSDDAATEYQRRSVYAGPRFADLDENLCASLESYLESRGLNDELAEFIAQYASWKEQKEYMDWLSKMHKFVDN